MTTDHNEALRLAEWHDEQAHGWWRAAELKAVDHAEPVKSSLQRKSAFHKEAAALLRQQAEQIDQLRAEVERMRELLKIPVPSNHTHQCRVCLYAYTPGTDNEDCPRCGFDGANPSTSRTTHKETE